MTVLICAATSFEASHLRTQLGDRPDVRVIETGVGPVNAAYALTMAITQTRPEMIVSCGVGGAYPSSGLNIGDVVCAAEEIYGDLGAQSASGFLDMRAMGFPVVQGPVPLFNELPLQVFPLSRRARFVTVSTVTGTDATARELESRLHGDVENMEGAAIVHVATLHEIPVGEVRGISNMVGNRDRQSWRLQDAAQAAQASVIEWIKASRPQDTSRPE